MKTILAFILMALGVLGAPELNVAKVPTAVTAAAIKLDNPVTGAATAPLKAATLASYTLLPVPTPNVVAAFFSILMFVTIFLVGCCALSSLEGPTGFVERGLMMTKEY